MSLHEQHEQVRAVKQKIVDHFKKFGRCPNFDSVGGYEASNEAFISLIADGRLVCEDYLSPKGRKLYRYRLAW